MHQPRLKIPPLYYSWAWSPAYAFGLGLAALSIRQTVHQAESGNEDLEIIASMIFGFTMACFIVASIWQFTLYLTGSYFTRSVYFGSRAFFMACTVVAMIGCIVALLVSGGRAMMTWGGIFALYQCVLWIIEQYLVGTVAFRDFMIGDMILTCLGYLIAVDSNTKDSSPQASLGKTWRQFKALLKRPRTGPIALPTDDNDNESSLELAAALATPPRSQRPQAPAWTSPAGFSEHLTHWTALSSEWHTHKALWITAADPETHKQIAAATCHHLAAAADADADADPSPNVALVDVSHTCSICWPMVHGLASASPEFRQEMGTTTPQIVSELFRWFPVHRRLYGVPPQIGETSDYYRELKDLVDDCIIKPILRLHRQLAGRVVFGDLDIEELDTAYAMPRTILIIYGIQNEHQAAQTFDVIRILQDRLQDSSRVLGVVVVSLPKVFRNVVEKKISALRRLSVVHMVGSDFMLYSESAIRAPLLSENIFRVLLDGVYRMGGLDAQRIWPEIKQISQDGLEIVEDETDTPILKIFAQLHRVSEDRKQIHKLLSSMPAFTRSRMFQALVMDNTEVAELLQELFVLGNYKEEIQIVPKEHSTAALNLIHSILDNGVFNENTEIFKNFSQQARRILNVLVGHLGLLPDELAVNNVCLRSDHPVNRGGFAIIYRGYYQNTDDTQVEVALKVLPIFGSHSDEEKRRTLEKFSKEALVWRYLKHRNIVPFLGIDSTTFESPQRALVSPWMAQGSVLDFVAENSPVAPYALGLFCDIIQGLQYLHNQNVIHGDLCGRNILITEDGRACLSDFGLAAFIDADTSAKSSSRSGSRQWMSPELLNPPPGTHFRRTVASDVWAFACVCCEIWTQGTVPFSHMGKGDPGIYFALGNAMQNPYIDKPVDKAQDEMPEPLWELCQWCWHIAPSERPAMQVIVDMLFAMKPHKNSVSAPTAPTASGSTAARSFGVLPGNRQGDTLTPVPSGSKGKRRAVASPFSAQTAVVQLGPLPAYDVSHPEMFFAEVFETLLERARLPQNALVEPVLVYSSAEGLDCLDLHFRSLVEANSFAMTWERHRFEPYLECSAFIVDQS